MSSRIKNYVLYIIDSVSNLAKINILFFFIMSVVTEIRKKFIIFTDFAIYSSKVFCEARDAPS